MFARVSNITAQFMQVWVGYAEQTDAFHVGAMQERQRAGSVHTAEFAASINSWIINELAGPARRGL